MYVLGISGGIDLTSENRCDYSHNKLTGIGIYHDSAAVLLKDGVVIAAIEEERLSRIKHTNKAPINAMEFCLSQANISMNEIDILAICGTKKGFDVFLWDQYYFNRTDFREEPNIIDQIIRNIQVFFNISFDCNKIYFIDHHLAHAASTYYQSGFLESLIVTIDGGGDGKSGIIARGCKNNIDIIEENEASNSLGMLYVAVTHFLGFSAFDEYKVMGLAPYGDPSIYDSYFKKIYTLLKSGKYIINYDILLPILLSIGKPRTKGEPITQQHKNIAASLQYSFEKIFLHIMSRYIDSYDNVCFAGGVAHNCSMMGKLRDSRYFKNVFIQPAAHDAGGALGAALYIANKHQSEQIEQIKHVYWGTHLLSSCEILNEIKKWDGFVTYRHTNKIEEEAADLLANGYVIGWLQGRSEFGPRALGNRSILADPRPAENKSRINWMVKKREAFRPFAPSIKQECMCEFFVANCNENLPFMNFTVQVREDKVNLLGAITHVDKSARIQTVSRDTNERYWKLIDAFQKKTGVPILLNTSFNNNKEPIVNTERDAIVCYLTTGLDYLVIDDYIISKKKENEHILKSLLDLRIRLPEHKVLKSIMRPDMQKNKWEYCIESNYTNYDSEQISYEIYCIIRNDRASKCIRNLFEIEQIKYNDFLLKELYNLWCNRCIVLEPS